MKFPVKIAVFLFATVHLGFFLVESVLWPVPFIHQFLLPKLNPGSASSLSEQASTLRSLLINQGFYNLILAFGAVWAASQKERGANLLLRFLGYAALTAGLLLALTTHLYVGALLQTMMGLVVLGVSSAKN